ncbi:hypothetical protein LXD69_13850 [Flavobacterium sediminilitoris]|uniref:Outer membrane protein with beta-barrel domain n=1 Tax=Flavobacterium sediminilitoris TaxID=2024526 RepID=A0ABY4HJT8_9FLAO|nr:MULTISPECIES: hypothetical protein [Flavobacterium]UOX33117.1 hypothetical protein LXD69_13850 [Flavobacterium sediminilitoris]
MKTTTFILYFLFFGIIGYSQVKTKIIKIDLGKPNENSISNTNNFKWLSVKPKNMISIQLINGNPLKYDYKINTKSISYFNDEKQLKKELDEVKNNENSQEEIKELIETTTTIQNIIDNNKKLNEYIDSLNIEVETLYEILKQKDVLKENDYKDKRELFLKISKKIYGFNYKQINELEDFKKDAKYLSTQKSLLKTKDKAEKSTGNIIKKLFSFNLEQYILPIDIQGQNIDAIEFKLKRFDKETKEEDVNFASKPYNIWIKGGLKIDVSAGIFFSSVYDREFDTKDDLTVPGNKIITLKNRGDYDFAFGSTVNTYIRMNSWIVPSINFGAALTANQKFQFLLGVGAILGKQERIIFTTGLAMGKVERIADSYNVGNSYNLGDSGTIPTQTQFKFGHFFGITYNLSKVKKISLEKGIE